MKKILLLSWLILSAFVVSAQETKSQLTNRFDEIRNETQASNNTRARIANAYQELADGTISVFPASASGTNSYATSINGIDGYSGRLFFVSFQNANTNSSVTLSVNTMPAEPIRKWDGASWVALDAGDIVAGKLYRLYADGTRLQIELGGTVSSVSWGDLLGTLSDQTDLQAALDAKQATLVSGTNIKTLESTSLLGSGNIDLTKSDVGLSNVDNTSDVNKPISTATQTALDGKADNSDLTTRNNLPPYYKVTNYSLVPGDTSRVLILQSPFTTLTLGSFASGVDGSQFVIYNETGATVTIDPDTYITKGPLEILDTTYAYIHFAADTFRISTATESGDTFWSSATGVTLTGANTITSNTANQLLYNGAWTATANNQYHIGYSGTITGRTTTLDRFTYFNASPNIIFGTYSSGGTTGQLYNLTPAFNSTGVTGSGFATTIGIRYAPTGVSSSTHNAILIETGKVGIGTSTPLSTTSHTVEINSPSGTNPLKLIGSQTQSFFGNGTFTSTISGPGTSTIASGSIVGNAYTANNTGFTSGSNTVTAYSVGGTINTSGSFTGNYTGYYFAPTITSNTGSTLAFNNTVGSVLIGHTALNASTTRLQVRGIGTTTGQLALFQDNGGTSRVEILDNGQTTVNGRLRQTQGADVASVAGAIALGGDGNSFEITGTNAITLISNTNWQNGSIVTLLFTSTATLTDGTANIGSDIGMELAGNTDFVATADDVVTLVLSEIGGTQRWREVSRSVN